MEDGWSETLERLLEAYEAMLKTPQRPDEVESILRRMVSQEDLDKVRYEHLRRAQRTLSRQPAMDGRPDRPGWYVPDPEGRFWSQIREHYAARDDWEADDVTTLDESSDDILARLDAPYEDRFSTRGLVLGYIQSGKTANYSAVIAKAADQGFRLFIVLSGTTEDLRHQTETRLRAELLERNREHWHTLTAPDSDFVLKPLVANPAAMLSDSERKCLAVVKKNTAPLKKLRTWLAAAGVTLDRVPVLVIDDEADTAGINTRDEEDPSAVNEAIVELLRILPRVSYVAYTATPFANFFVNPTDEADLFPRHFIKSLPKPNRHYFGPERLFGRLGLDSDESERVEPPLDVIRTIPADEVPLLKPPRSGQPAMVPSLSEAIDYFLLAAAARYARRLTDEHTTMLVHTSHLMADHWSLRSVISERVTTLKAEIATGDVNAIERLRVRWIREMSRVPSSLFDLSPVPWETLLASLVVVAEQCAVLVNDSSSADGQKYQTGEPGVFIVIGGNVLARGLTLKGLVASYFARTAGTYDALLQMGRWFGYRRNYEDLPRVWMTDELEVRFVLLATVEEEIRRQIAQMEEQRLLPLDAAIKVRLHPGWAITSRNKMQSTEEGAGSYSETQQQTIQFYINDRDWLETNIEATRRLVRSALDGQADCVELLRALQPTGKWLLRGLQHQAILDFIDEYRLYENFTLQPGALSSYVHREVRAGSLEVWDVAILGLEHEDERLGTIDLGLPHRVNLINRSQYGHGSPAVLKQIRSPGDIEMVQAALSAYVPGYDSNPGRNSRGLLLVYPISARSAPQRGGGAGDEDAPSLRPLNAPLDVIGVSYVFPKARVPSAVKFRSNKWIP